MAAKPLYRVIARPAPGVLSGVKVAREGSAAFPTTCDLGQAAILHLGEARKLAKWARAHMIDSATYERIGSTPANLARFVKVERLLSGIFG